MSNYVKATNFYAKDALVSGNPDKIIKGAEIDDEYNAIATSISTKADLNSPTFTGIPLAPTAAIGTNTTQVATTAFAIANGIPSGGIIMWSGSVVSIPTGFALCDGTNGTPDLRNKFIVGAGSTYAVNATGGSADAVIVSHSHTATSTVTDPGHTHNLQNLGSAQAGPDNGGAPVSVDTGWSTGRSPAPTASATTGISVATSNSTTGVSGTNANLPPYLALAYIMKL
jgi:hypothetical protein